MTTFDYTAKNKNGKVTRGTIEIGTRDDAVISLENQGLTPVTVTTNEKFSLSKIIDRYSIIPLSEKVLFSQELATLVGAGVPISQSLAMLEKQTKNKRFKETIAIIAKDVEGGLPLSVAIEKHPLVFSPLFVSMVKSGEIGGTLDESLNRLADQMVKDKALVSKIRGAMIYPAVIFVGMVCAMIFMLVTIVPTLQDMFKEMGGDLPFTTKSLIFLSDALTKYGIITLAVIVSIVIGYRYALKHNYKFKYFIHSVILKTPVVGNLTTKMNIARFSRTLGSLLNSGVSIVESLQIIANASQNVLFKEALDKSAEKVKNGSSIGETFKNFEVIPLLVTQMISVGEETGSLDKILNKVADFYDSEVENMSRNLTVLLEPLIMIFIGIMVGYLIIAIIGPIYAVTGMV